MGRMHEGFSSDQLKRQIKTYKERKGEGSIESYQDITGEKYGEGNLGMSKKL